MTQRPVDGMRFSTILQVPSTHGSTLLNNLVSAEQQLATMSGYNVKLVEMSGIQLARIFQRVYSPHKCHWLECPVCKEHTAKGASRCRNSNIVYEGVCIECLDEVQRGVRKKGAVGKYIGESSRTLAERSLEHSRGAMSIDPDNFIVKHWVTQHSELESAPRIKFNVVKTFKDPLSRLVAESVLIDKVSNLNSKSEWRNNKMSRLVVEVPAWLDKKEKQKDTKDADYVNKKIEELKVRRESIQKVVESAENVIRTKAGVPKISKQSKRGCENVLVKSNKRFRGTNWKQSSVRGTSDLREESIGEDPIRVEQQDGPSQLIGKNHLEENFGEGSILRGLRDPPSHPVGKNHLEEIFGESSIQRGQRDSPSHPVGKSLGESSIEKGLLSCDAPGILDALKVLSSDERLIKLVSRDELKDECVGEKSANDQSLSLTSTSSKSHNQATSTAAQVQKEGKKKSVKQHKVSAVVKSKRINQNVSRRSQNVMAEWLGRGTKREGRDVQISSPANSPTYSLNVISNAMSHCTKPRSNHSVTC